MESNTTAARNAKRFLTTRVRDNWSWPTTPPCFEHEDEEVRGVVEFRERFYGSTAEEDSEDEPQPASSSSAAKPDPYKFDSPDSIGDALGRKGTRLKRTRWAALEAEMGWNEGLREFVARREAWTGAAAVKKFAKAGNSTAAAASAPPEATPPPPPAQEPEAPEADSVDSVDPAYPLVPVAPRMLADNPIRKSIKPSTYTDIYNNIVITGRTPSVPVNLSDMTRALVVGWKDTGEWPPKPGPLDPLAGRKRAAPAQARLEHGDGPFLAHHPHVKKGVDQVKRIFHLNGHHENAHGGTNG